MGPICPIIKAVSQVYKNNVNNQAGIKHPQWDEWKVRKKEIGGLAKKTLKTQRAENNLKYHDSLNFAICNQYGLIPKQHITCRSSFLVF